MFGVGGEVGADVARQVGEGLLDAAVEQDEATGGARGGVAGEGFAQGEIARGKQVAGEHHREGVMDGDLLEVGGHDFSRAFVILYQRRAGVESSTEAPRASGFGVSLSRSL